MRFRIRTLMIAVAATAVFFGAYIGLAEVLRWYFFHHRAQIWRGYVEQVEARKGTSREMPADALLLRECQQNVAELTLQERKHQPHILRVACLIAVIGSPWFLATRGIRRWWKRRRVHTELVDRFPCDSPDDDAAVDDRRGGRGPNMRLAQALHVHGICSGWSGDQLRCNLHHNRASLR